MGAACVPKVKVPPALTLAFPPTIVRLLLATVLNCSVPVTVVVLARKPLSIVTVVPLTTLTALHWVGTWLPAQVGGADQLPLAWLAIVDAAETSPETA